MFVNFICFCLPFIEIKYLLFFVSIKKLCVCKKYVSERIPTTWNKISVCSALAIEAKKKMNYIRWIWRNRTNRREIRSSHKNFDTARQFRGSSLSVREWILYHEKLFVGETEINFNSDQEWAVKLKQKFIVNFVCRDVVTENTH